ncbi:MAG: protein kinase [Muribaculaceae bacterium]|nr:protein kinase [Muribaculaceae bacterium]
MDNDKQFTYALPPGTVLRGHEIKYKIIKVLGQGGFGITYLASGMFLQGNIWQDGRFAIKELFVKDICHRDAGDPTMRYGQGSQAVIDRSLGDFKSEASKLEQICKDNAERARRTGADSLIINNRHIVPVNEIFEANGTAYFVMEYLDGGSLRDMVNREGPLPEAKALRLMRPIISAVDFLHSKRIMHLDIKPDNIVMRSERGALRAAPMLIDFGLSLHFDSGGHRTSMAHGCGYTPGYSPLEQMSGVSTFDPKLDVYSLGATLYFLLTGLDPENASTISTEDVMRRLNGVSPEAVTAICNAMQRDSALRTYSAPALLEQLNSLPEVPDDMPSGYTRRVDTPTGPTMGTKLKEKLARAMRAAVPYLPLITVVAAVVIGAIVLFKTQPWRGLLNSSSSDSTIVANTDSMAAVPTDTVQTEPPIAPEQAQPTPDKTAQEAAKTETAPAAKEEPKPAKPEDNKKPAAEKKTVSQDKTNDSQQPAQSEETTAIRDTKALNYFNTLRNAGSTPDAAQLATLRSMLKGTSPRVSSQIKAYARNAWDADM